jgi:hypothetical protein
MRPESEPDAGWVSALADRAEPDARPALEEARAKTALFRHLAREHEREGRESYVEIDAPLELYALVRLLAPRHVLEVGVSSGVSSAYLLAALERNGRGTLHSVDLPSRPRRRRDGPAPAKSSWSLPPGREPGWAVPVALRKRWDLRIGDKAEVLPVLAEELPRVELYLYDVPHEDRATRAELRRLEPTFGPGTVVIVDHGPGGALCSALRSWARAHCCRPVRRTGLGLYGARSLSDAGSRVPRSGVRRGEERPVVVAGSSTGRTSADARPLSEA